MSDDVHQSPKKPFFPKELTTVTGLSKLVALYMLIVLPVIGFYMGRNVQYDIDNATMSPFNEYRNIRTKTNPVPTISTSNEWKSYADKNGNYSFNYPSNWVIRDISKSYTIDNNSPLMISAIGIYQATNSIHNTDSVQVFSNPKRLNLLDFWKQYEYSCCGQGARVINYGQIVSEGTDIVVDGIKAKRIVKPPGDLAYTNLNWITFTSEDKVYSIYVENNQALDNVVLSTFKLYTK